MDSPPRRGRPAERALPGRRGSSAPAALVTPYEGFDLLVYQQCNLKHMSWLIQDVITIQQANVFLTLQGRHLELCTPLVLVQIGILRAVKTALQEADAAAGILEMALLLIELSDVKDLTLEVEASLRTVVYFIQNQEQLAPLVEMIREMLREHVEGA